jgi:hypothetical protein
METGKDKKKKDKAHNFVKKTNQKILKRRRKKKAK